MNIIDNTIEESLILVDQGSREELLVAKQKLEPVLHSDNVNASVLAIMGRIEMRLYFNGWTVDRIIPTKAADYLARALILEPQFPLALSYYADLGTIVNSSTTALHLALSSSGSGEETDCSRIKALLHCGLNEEASTMSADWHDTSNPRMKAIIPWAHFWNKNFELSLKTGLKFMREYPFDTDVPWVVALSFYMFESGDEGIDYLLNHTKRSLLDYRCFYFLGYIMYAQGYTKDAMKIWNDDIKAATVFIDVEPNNPMVRGWRARMFARLGNRKKALKDIKVALLNGSDNGHSLMHLAIVYHYLKEYDSVTKLLKICQRQGFMFTGPLWELAESNLYKETMDFWSADQTRLRQLVHRGYGYEFRDRWSTALRENPSFKAHH